MKKFILLTLLVLLTCAAGCAKEFETVSSKSAEAAQNRIDEIGFRILNSNGIEKRTVFDFSTKSIKNAGSSMRNRQITIYRGLYNRLNSDNEMAAVLAHEISHSVDSYNGIFKGYFSPLTYNLSPRKYEYKADKRAVDYMVNAGYNPVAFIIVMNKTFPQERYDWYSTHPLASRRMMEIYEYIYKKYPEYLANNEYKNNIYYQNFLLTSKENREKFQNKIQTRSKRNVRYL